MPLRGFKNDVLTIDPQAIGRGNRGQCTVTLSCGHSFTAWAPRDAWWQALYHLKNDNKSPCKGRTFDQRERERAEKGQKKLKRYLTTRGTFPPAR